MANWEYESSTFLCQYGLHSAFITLQCIANTICSDHWVPSASVYWYPHFCNSLMIQVVKGHQCYLICLCLNYNSSRILLWLVTVYVHYNYMKFSYLYINNLLLLIQYFFVSKYLEGMKLCLRDWEAKYSVYKKIYLDGSLCLFIKKCRVWFHR